MGFVTIKDKDGVEHTIHASQLPASNQTPTVTYGCSECDKIRADLAAAQRELAAYREPTLEDARELYLCESSNEVLATLKQLGFVRKVRP